MVELPEQLEPLKKCPQWVCHLNKRPKNPNSPNLEKISQDQNSANAQQNNPATWGTYDHAVAACEKYKLSGIGFQFGVNPEGSLRFSGIDLDHVVREDGTLEPFAVEIVKLMDSYTELSFSGRGLHILCKTSMENIGRRTTLPGNMALEMYNHRHYFTVTGKVFGEPKPIQERTEQFKKIHEHYFKTPEKEGEPKSIDSPLKSPGSNISDKELWDYMFRSKKGSDILDLYSGRLAKYNNDASRADLALCSALAYFTGGDTIRVDKMFRQSRLMRSKWDEKHNSQGQTYGEMTIKKAIASISCQSSAWSNEKTPFQSLGNYIQMAMKSDIELFQNYKTRKTGFPNLDKEMEGHLYPGLYIVAATSSLGKTTFCHQLADQLAQNGEHVLFFSLEQSRFELASKGISRLTAKKDLKSAVSAVDIREGNITDTVKQAIIAYSEFTKNEFIIECGFDTTIETIKRTVGDYISQTGIRPVVFVDYLQIIRPIGTHQTIKDAVDAHIRALKKIQSDNDLVVITISSLNRQNYLAPISFEALKESGNLEYSCDVLWGLQLNAIHDELFENSETYIKKRKILDKAKEKLPREIELVCLKNRYGKCHYACHFNYYAQFDYFTPAEGSNREKTTRL